MRMSELLLLALIALSFVACSRDSKVSSSPAGEPYSPSQGSLGFDIRPLSQPRGSFLASYTSRGKTAKFRVELDPATPSKNADFPISFGKGRLLAEPGSEPESFLADLAKVLEAKKTAKRASQRAATLPFEYVTLGEKQSRSKDGSFSDSPSGDWTLMKLFFGDDQGEVYLNFSPMLNKSESIKDEDYGDFVISELAKVL